MHRFVLCLAVTACGSPAATPEHATPPAVVDAQPIDAAIPQPEADELADAPAWVFRYDTPARKETWTLRFREGQAALTVETSASTLHYTGTATEDATLAIAVATSNAKLVLDCKRVQRSLGATCNDAKAPKRDVLDCYVPNFATPMPFGPAPGVAFVQSDACTGYRLYSPTAE